MTLNDTAAEYDETAHFNAELAARMALRLGRSAMDGEAATLRAEFAERKLRGAMGRLAEIEKEVETMMITPEPEPVPPVDPDETAPKGPPPEPVPPVPAD